MDAFKVIALELLTFVFILGVGLRMLSFFKIKFKTKLAPYIFSIGLGTGILGFLILFLGMLNMLYAKLVLSILLMVILLNLKILFILRRDTLYFLKRSKMFLSSRLDVFLILVILLALGLNILGVVAPAIGQDALVYHLSDARYFAENHTTNKRIYSSNCLYPYLIEMLFTYGLLFGSEDFAKSFNFLFLILILLSTYTFACRYMEKDKSLLAGVVTFFIPAIFVLAKYAYVEVGLSAFTTLAFLSLMNFLEEKDRKWLILTGIFIGFCLSIKAFGWYTMSGIVLIVFYEFFSKREFRKAFQYTFLLLLVSLLIGGVWYFRSWLGWGNPFYPYYVKFLGENGWYIPGPVGVDSTLKNLLFLPLLLTLKIDKFGGGENQFGLLFLIFLPLILFSFYKNKEIRYLSFACLFFIVAWFYTYQNVRHLIPYVPLFSIITFFSFKSVAESDTFIRKFLSSTIIFVLLLNLSLNFYYYRRELNLSLGRISEKEYIFRYDRSGKVADYVNKRLPQNAKILLIAESRDYRFKREVVRDIYYQRHVNKGGLSDIIRILKRDGFTHIIYREKGNKRTPAKDLRLFRNLMKVKEFRDKYLLLEEVIDYNYDSAHKSKYYIYRIK